MRSRPAQSYPRSSCAVDQTIVASRKHQLSGDGRGSASPMRQPRLASLAARRGKGLFASTLDGALIVTREVGAAAIAWLYLAGVLLHALDFGLKQVVLSD